MIARRGRLALLLCLSLAACGDLPEPFLGNPGARGRFLAQPPTPRLAVPPPQDALLPNAASHDFALALAAGLQAQEVPAVADRVQANDWSLRTRAEQHGGAVVPTYTVLTPKGDEKGTTEGPPVPTPAWADASAATLQQAAKDAAPKIASLLTGINTATQRADPNSLYNRVAKVQMVPVTGAPGDGNASLTREMKSHLSKLGVVVQDSAKGADFIVKGDVRMVPIPGGQQRVEIQWSVAVPSGDERGRVIQLNDIPAGSLDHYWADVAVVVATEASGGVNDVILRQSGKDPAAQQSGKEPAAPPPVNGQAPGALVEGTRPGTGRPAP
jgi:hypothetical protein